MQKVDSSLTIDGLLPRVILCSLPFTTFGEIALFCTDPTRCDCEPIRTSRGRDGMRPTRRRILGLAGALCALAESISSLRAQGTGWPSKPIRIIVPGGPGGVTDIRARWLGDRLGPALGQLIVVENRPDAGGNLGTAAAARSAPYGYTLVIVHIGTMAINPHLYASPGYDSLTDLAPITRLGVGPQVLAVHKDVPARSVAELLSLAKAKPGELTFVSPGIGTPGHLASSMLMHLTGIRATHVPYKGGGQAVVDLV